MAFWSNFFGQTENKYELLKDRLSFHEATSQANLHESHPHLQGLFDKHQIDLKKIRKHGVRVAAAAAVLGAFLAIPYLIGHPIVTPPKQPSVTGGAAGQLVPNQPPTFHGSAQENVGQQAPGTGGVSPPSTPEQPPGDQPKTPGHQGHTHGRSYLAPPKEHGFHDLGLHKGAAKNPQVPKVGPHPSDLDVNKGGGSS